MKFSIVNLESLSDKITLWMATNGIKILIALIILFVGWKLVNKIVKKSIKLLKQKHFDATVASFLEAFLDIALKIILIIMLLEYVGFNIAGLVTVLASAGLAVGLALQGSLSNLAGGVIILILRPFKVGDYIDADGKAGKVHKIQIFYTHLLTSDNREIMIPNGKLANGNIINYSSQDKRRVDLTFTVLYQNDLKKVKEILTKVVIEQKLIIEEPAAKVVMTNQISSSISFEIKAWCLTKDYWTVYYDLLEQVKIEFDENEIAVS